MDGAQLTDSHSSQAGPNLHYAADHQPMGVSTCNSTEHILIQPTLFEQHVPRTRHDTNKSRDWIIAKVESVFESIVDSILEDQKKLTITLRSRGRVTDQGLDHESRSIRPASRHRKREVSFPGGTPKEAWKFTVLVRILQLIHEALISGVVTTKRDMYYKDPALFLRQDVVDKHVDDIACTFGVERGFLNVELVPVKVAAAKGLVAGALKLMKKDQSTLDYASGDEAKGYPDISTRAFLRLLSRAKPTASQNAFLPIYALVDFDPDGLGILSTYKYGSVALAHENAQLTVSSIRWLGVRSGDLQGGSTDEVQGLLGLSARDRGKALKMLGNEVFAEEFEWRREMQVMLFLNFKAEIQVMSGFGKVGLEKWIEERVLDQETHS
ncbi:hypothetical protein FGG08_003311 [Glutinoglossum americanum]|uniref:DNA topoisomerase (ATP-hydrolyzing) n=1 Tax=Glutinoglossum americanum TaxID=1670608 RepID=A0A9P8HYK0_9PEZI|nr:hypothetical protein FGG08_003311 [Glutinoglossum americanum]